MTIKKVNMFFWWVLFLFLNLVHLTETLAAEDALSATKLEESSSTETLKKNEQKYILEDGSSVYYSPMTYTSAITNIPKSSWTFLKEAFGPGTFWPWMGILGSTALLYVYDEEILLESERFGRRLGLGNEDNTKTFITLGDISIFRGPTDLGSALYFLGDGWTHTAIGLGFVLYGENAENNRALNTGLQIFHGMFFSTIFNQFIKRTSGRESPFVRTEPRGAIRPFPSIAAYGENSPKFDAYPSGHVMTATMTFTIMIENYPEYSHILKPLEYTWLTLLMFQMMNNGVHWASDYPLGIAMGYLAGKIATRYGKRHQAKPGESQTYLMPMLEEGTLGVQAIYRF